MELPVEPMDVDEFVEEPVEPMEDDGSLMQWEQSHESIDDDDDDDMEDCELLEQSMARIDEEPEILSTEINFQCMYSVAGGPQRNDNCDGEMFENMFTFQVQGVTCEIYMGVYL